MGGGARAGAGTGGAGAHAGAGTGSAHAGARTSDAGTHTGTATTSGNPHAGAGAGSAHAGAGTGGAGAHAGAATTSGNPHTGTGTGADANALADYLRAQATEFLRALRRHRESGAGAGASGPGAGGPGRTAPPADDVDAVRALRRAARRISGTLHTFQPLLDASWAEEMRPELAWLSGTLALEHAYASRLERLLQALHRLSGSSAFPAPRPVGRTTAATNATNATTTSTVPTGVPAPARPASPDRGSLTVGAAKAGALLDRQLTLARTRAHSTALQALGSSRFHAVADKVALLASEVPLRVAARPNRGATAPETTPCDLRPLAAAAEERLADAVTALPLVAAGSPYNAQALVHGLSPDPAPHPQDAPWHQVRLLLRLHRYALEALAGADAADAGDPGDVVDVRLLAAGEALDRHRDASEAAAAAAQAARTPRIAPATAYALGVLHADQRHEVEAARYAFQHSWRKEPIRLP
ncbi:CHAD domain-containing protein [Streptomyces sp. SID10362]|uniref:CHAD domain-containing protein n=1 Tax=Streptomyces sp. SID10362 TaxID=2706021 RepID=UPI001F156EDA|nr:CHAD domain-containing protein [Streptomyces sp. SID10362]